MYTKEQEEMALKEFEKTGSVRATIQRLGYPSSSTLYRWYEHKKAGIENRHGNADFCQIEGMQNGSRSGHYKNPSAEFKYAAIHRCFDLGEDVEYISREIGYSRQSIYVWRRKYLKQGMVGLMSKAKRIPREELQQAECAHSEKAEIEALRSQIQDLQLEVDVLKETLNILKKDPGVDLTGLKNREKAVLIGALEKKYALPTLLAYLNMSRSSFYYQKSITKRVDKYTDLRLRIREIFYDNRSCYGYRRLYMSLKKEGTTVSEKIVRRIMREESLEVISVKCKKYSSYQGEISPEVENIIARDFHAEQPNEKWLTDITEFAPLCGKIYLSPIIDCFDGTVVSWTAGGSPNAELVNTMLDQAIDYLPEGAHPIVHSDRGCHYRWPGWIERMNRAGLTRSMSRKGCSADNSACEGFFGRLKNEMFYGRSWQGVSQEKFIEELNRYIHWYNEKRIKQSLGGLSPREYRHSLGFEA